MAISRQNGAEEIHAAETKYYRDRASLMELFHVARTKWTVRTDGKCVYAVSDLGNTIWAKNLLELQDVLVKAGVDTQDIRGNCKTLPARTRGTRVPTKTGVIGRVTRPA